MPSEFVRQPRGLEELKRFKATEFRSFLLYFGATAIKDIVQKPVFDHFLTLVVALRILLNEDEEFRNTHLGYARQLLVFFVNRAPEYYGQTFVVYNVHNLIHLPDDAEYFDASLDKISCFPFENHLQSIKKKVRNANNPLVSIVKRIIELENCNISNSHKSTNTKASLRERDSWFYLQEGNVAQIIQIKSKESFLCNVFRLDKLEDYFTIPCKSSFVGIHFLPEKTSSKKKTITEHEFQRKFVCLPINGGLLLVSMLSNVNFK